MKLHGSIAAIAVLALAGCHSNTDAAANNDAGATYGDNLADNAADGDFDQTDSASIVEVPVPASTGSAEVAPLVEAAAVSSAISDGSDVERVPYDGGWAWRRNGQIVRTASRDGRRVSYFRAGQTAPFLVQDGDRAYAFSDGRLQHSYDDRGRAVAVDQSHRQESEQLARHATQERSEAIRVASQQPDRIQPERPVSRGTDGQASFRAHAARTQGPRDGSDPNRHEASSRPQSRSTPEAHGRNTPGATPTAGTRSTGNRSREDATGLGPRADQPLPAATGRPSHRD